MATEGIYPLSTQDGKTIPLEIIKPLGLVAYEFDNLAAAEITIPEGYDHCWIYATESCILAMGDTVLPDAPVDGTSYENTLFIPSGTVMTVLLEPGAATLLGIEEGKLYINSFLQWGALAQAKQVAIG